MARIYTIQVVSTEGHTTLPLELDAASTLIKGKMDEGMWAFAGGKMIARDDVDSVLGNIAEDEEIQIANALVGGA